jgi:hypothetical protein
MVEHINKWIFFFLLGEKIQAPVQLIIVSMSRIEDQARLPGSGRRSLVVTGGTNGGLEPRASPGIHCQVTASPASRHNHRAPGPAGGPARGDGQNLKLVCIKMPALVSEWHSGTAADGEPGSMRQHDYFQGYLFIFFTFFVRSDY